MKVNIQSVGFTAQSRLLEFVEQKVGKLLKFEDRIEGAEVYLELESGSNDPMAYMLTIALIQYVTGGSEGSIGSILLTFLLQFSVGGLLGYAMGWLTVKFLNKANIGNEALYPILLLCAVFLTFSATTLLQGNGYLAVYIMGVVVGNKKVIHKKSIVTFFDGLTWLLQIALFIILGLFVDAPNLIDDNLQCFY